VHRQAQLGAQTPLGKLGARTHIGEPVLPERCKALHQIGDREVRTQRGQGGAPTCGRVAVVIETPIL